MKKILKSSIVLATLAILIPIKVEAKGFGSEQDTETREIGSGYC